MSDDVRVEIRGYIVTTWPEGLGEDWEAGNWEISVHRTRIPGMWAVTARGGDLPILTKKGNWSWKMPRNLRPSCYMPLDQALAAASKAAREMTIHGMTLEEFLKWRSEPDA